MKASQLTKENITPEIVDKLLFEGLDYKGETADVIIVLGSRKACDYRVPLAAKLFHEGKAPHLIFCGGKVQKTSLGDMAEYKAMLIAAEKCGIPTSAITVETHSLDTVENLQNAAKLVKEHFPNCKSIIVVTTAYHMRRAAMLAQHFFTQKIIPCPASRGSTQRNNWSMTASRTKNNITLIHEDIKQVYHKLFNKALDEYNAKQKRKDRQIKSYYEKISRSKQEKLFYEVIVQIGNRDEIGRAHV